ncbi:Uncharacterised protein [Mycobacterium tuberculosis]|nr:Uncharacterised protein [Mycobacterium tuberculosis]
MRSARVPKLGTASIAITFSGRHSRNTPPMHAAIVVTPTPPLPDTTVMTYCRRICRRIRPCKLR